MAESAISIRFKHCDFGEYFAEATAAYDSDPQTAWIAPFTLAQQAYWSSQGDVVNGYAEEYARRRLESITSAAQSAYDTCLRGGAAVGSATPTNADVAKAWSELETANQAATAAHEELTKATAEAVTASHAYAARPHPVNANYVSWTHAAVTSAQTVADLAAAEVAAKSAVHSAAVEEAAKPHFSLSLNTQLTGGGAVSGTLTHAELSAQVSVPFNAVTLVEKKPLDWKAFYRLDTVYTSCNYPANWVMSFQGANPYTASALTELTMRDGVHIQAMELVGITANIIQYMDAPAGETLSVPDALAATFYPVSSNLSMNVYREVHLPNGDVDVYHVNYSATSAGGLGDFSETLYFPPLAVSCAVSGQVDVYHFITSFSFGTLYKLSNQLQQIRDGIITSEYRVPAQASGTTPPSYGPPGFLSIHESFWYHSGSEKLGIVRIKYKQQGVFRYQRMFLVWRGAPFSPESLAGMTSNAIGTKFYGKHLTETSNMSESITLSGGTALHAPNGTYTVPVIEDIVVSNFEEGTLTVFPTSNYVEYSQSIIKIKNVLKPLAVYTPYGTFVTEQPGYQATGNFLSVLPDFIDFVDFTDKLGLVRMYAHDTHSGQSDWRLFLFWVGTPIDAGKLIGLTMDAISVPTPPVAPASCMVHIRNNDGSLLVSLDVPIVEDINILQFNVISGSSTHVFPSVFTYPDDVVALYPPGYLDNYPGILVRGVLSTAIHQPLSIRANFSDLAKGQEVSYWVYNKNPIKFLETIDDFVFRAGQGSSY